jgi:glycosyltransferase involved in cell wall biosynthesis
MVDVANRQYSDPAKSARCYGRLDVCGAVVGAAACDPMPTIVDASVGTLVEVSAPTLLGVQVANGLSSEARVFATLLGHRATRYGATVLMHQDPREQPDHLSAVDAFGAIAKCDVVPYDSGWRRNASGRRRSPKQMLLAARYLHRIRLVVGQAERLDPSVVYSGQQHYDCRAATRVAAKTKTPQIIHLHYTVGSYLTRAVLDRLLTCDHVVTVSDFTRSEALAHGVPEGRVTTVRNCMEVMPDVDPAQAADVRASLGIPVDAYVFGMASRVDPGKGHLDAIAAFTRIAIRRSEVWLVIAGSGSDDANVRSAAAASAASERIVLAGHRSDIPVFLGSLDAFVHPSSNDPCPLAVLEAMASGLPVVAYGQAGALEMIRHGDTGLLATHLSVDSLAEQMTLLCEDAEFGTTLGTQARESIASDFRPDAAGRAFADVVELVARRR